MTQTRIRPSDSPPRPDADTLHSKATINYTSELVRKGIHLCSLAVPVIYYSISREFALALLIPVTGAFFFTDIARYFIPAVGRWYYRTFGWLLREHEQNHKARRLTGATNILLSAIACVALFPKIITVNAFAILIISDTTSALVGRRFGQHRFLKKSLEGAAAFFVSAVVVVLVAPKLDGSVTEYLIWVAGAAAGAFIEAAVHQVDDNISVPIGIGLVVWGLYALVLPGLDLNSLL